jgi:hypothetical protein
MQQNFPIIYLEKVYNNEQIEILNKLLMLLNLLHY